MKLKSPSMITIGLQRALPMCLIGSIVSHLLIPDDFNGPIEIEDVLLQCDRQQGPRLRHGQSKSFFFQTYAHQEMVCQTGLSHR
jgi:hypothetical protein